MFGMFLGAHMLGVAADHKSIKKVNSFFFLLFRLLQSYYYAGKTE